MAGSDHLAFIGTYTRGGSRGIYSVRLDPGSGALSAPDIAAESGNPTFLALSPDRRHLYAVRDSEAMAAAFALDPESGRLEPLPVPSAAAAPAPCHAAVDATGRVLVLTNYHRGYVAALPILPGGGLGPPQAIRHHGRGAHPVRQTEPHPHSTTISPDNRHALVCDLGLDRIFAYRIDPGPGRLGPAEAPFTAVPPGSGPRHFIFAAGGRRAYVVNEIASTVIAFRYDPESGMLDAFQNLSTLPAGFSGENTAAEIRLHPSGRFLYVSNRGHDSLALFAVAPDTGLLAPIETVPSGGRTPRHFALTPDGAWLLCAHQDSGNLTVFRADPATGRLARGLGAAAVPSSVCVLFLR